MAVQPVGVREIPVGKLTRFPGNARRGNAEEIRASVRRLGQYRTIVVRDTGSDLVILAGNHTTDALAAEGFKKVRCEVITCTDDEARRVNLADNRLAEMGSYENEALAELLTALGDDFDGTGWADADLEGFRHLLEPPDLDDLGRGLGDPDDDDAWPSIRIRAPRHVIAAWNDHVKTHSDDEAEALAALLGLEVSTA